MVLVHLRIIDENNFQQCIGLKASVESESFVDPVVYSLAEAWVYGQAAKPFAIYADDQMIGFVSLYVGEGNCQIINFLIADAYQNRGLGAEAAKACIRFLQTEYFADRISAPVEVENLRAQRFWAKLGFVPSDTVEDGYVFMRLKLS